MDHHFRTSMHPRLTGLLALAFALGSASSAHAAIKPISAGARPLLELDGVGVAHVQAYEGGAAVVSVGRGSQVRYEDLTVEINLPAEPQLMGWISTFLSGKSEPKSGAIVLCDVNFKAQERLTFSSASLRKVRFGALDAGAKEPLGVTLVLAPSRTRVEQTKDEACKAPATGKKSLIGSNFRFELDGVDGSGVISVDGLELTRGAQVSLRVTISSAHATDFHQWHQQGVDGKPSAKKLAIVLLDPTLKGELGRFDLGNARSVRCARERMEAGSEKGSRVVADLAVESLTFVPGKQ